MLYYMTWLISKLDPLKYICEKPYLSSRIARWQVLLAEYDIVFMMRKVVKESVIVDHVVEDYELLNFDLLDVYMLTVKDKN